ncbi:MAG: hypothetical protein ABSH22_20150, partial [Tepidisphaeraceae bacterium]
TDLSGPLKDLKEWQDEDLIAWNLHFCKWGKNWDVSVFMHAPVSDGLRRESAKILASFKLDGPPDDGNGWAIDLARKSLPAEAEPEKYVGESTRGEYQCKTAHYGVQSAVTFTKHLQNMTPKSWYFLVSSTGEVSPLKTDWAVDDSGTGR